MDKIIITAFEPFGGDNINPTVKILEQIPDYLYNHRVIKTTLPVVYNHAFDRLLTLIDKHQPKLILELGLAKGRSHVNLERIAINVSDATIADNLGTVLKGETIVKNGADGLFSSLPLKKIIKKTKEKKLPVQLSNSAGGYVCNNLFYHTLHHVKTYNMKTLVGFVHVPMLVEQVSDQPNVPSLPRSVMVEAVMTILDTVLNPIDYKETAQKIKGAQKAQ